VPRVMLISQNTYKLKLKVTGQRISVMMIGLMAQAKKESQPRV